MESKNHDNDQEFSETPTTSELNREESEKFQREIVTRSEEFRAFMMQSGFPGMEISNKITPEHINQMLATDAKKVDLASKDRHEDRIFKYAIIITAIVAVIILCVIFRDNVEPLQKIIIPILSFVAGAAGGYGVGKSKNDKSDD